MIRVLILFIVIGGGYFTLFPARADGCYFSGGNVSLGVPEMSIPADTPNGTVLYTSPKITKKVTCDLSYSPKPTSINFVTTADFNKFTSQNNGVKFTLYIDGVPYDKQMTQSIGSLSAGFWQAFSKDVSIWFDIKVDTSKGNIPSSGTYLSGGFESVYLIQGTNYGLPKGIISLSTPNITYIPCMMAISLNPDTIDFGAVKASDLNKGIDIQRRFTTLIQKNKGCTSTVNTPFSINMYFEPTASILNADGSLNLNNGLGLSISDISGKYVPYNTAWKLNDVRVDSVIKSNFTAHLKKISGQDVKTGPFSADVVVRINYY